MTKNYQRTGLDTSALAVPDQVSVAMGEIAAELREGLLALAVGAGLQVMQQLMEADVTAACGPRGRHDPDRTATRHGREAGWSRWAVVGCRCTGPGSAPATGPGSCRCRPMSCSPTLSCPVGWRWSGCWTGCRPAAAASERKLASNPPMNPNNPSRRYSPLVGILGSNRFPR